MLCCVACFETKRLSSGNKDGVNREWRMLRKKRVCEEEKRAVWGHYSSKIKRVYNGLDVSLGEEKNIS